MGNVLSEPGKQTAISFHSDLYSVFQS